MKKENNNSKNSEKENVTRPAQSKKANVTESTDANSHARQGCCHSSKCRFFCAVFVFLLVILCAAGEYFFSRYNYSKFSENNERAIIHTIGKSGKSYALHFTELRDDITDLQNEISLLKSGVSKHSKKVENEREELNKNPSGNNEQAIIKSEEGHALHSAKLRDDITELQNEISLLKSEVSKYSEKIENEKKEQNKNQLREKWKIWAALKSKIEANEPFEAELSKFNAVFAGDQELIAIVKDLIKGVDVFCKVDNNGSTSNNSNNIISTCKKYFRRIIRIKKIDYRKLLEVSGYVLSHVNKK